jgi:hypothetical protein
MWKASFRVIGVSLLLLALATVWESATPGTASTEAEGDGPVVQVVSPPQSGYVMHDTGKDLLVCLEIVDVAGAGIDSYDSGMPRFVDPDDNVEAFVDHVIARAAYINPKGQRVTQLVAKIPVHRLIPSQAIRVSPPVDGRRLREIASVLPAEDRNKGFLIPAEAMVEVAEFRFRVKDLNGVKSGSGSARPPLLVGLASTVFVPPAPDSLEESAPSSDEKTRTPEPPPEWPGARPRLDLRRDPSPESAWLVAYSGESPSATALVARQAVCLV